MSRATIEDTNSREPTFRSVQFEACTESSFPSMGTIQRGASLEGEVLALDVDLYHMTRRKSSAENGLGQRILQLAKNRALQRPRTEVRIVAEVH